MKHIKKAVSYSMAGSIGLSVIASLGGCSDQGVPPPDMQGFGDQQGENQESNYFLVVEQVNVSPDEYKVIEKHPTTGPSRAILRGMDGTERFLSEAELKKLAEEEAAKVESGTSRLTQENTMQSGGMSLGETILAAAAGSLIGGMLANRLMGNRNFQKAQNRYGGGRPTTSISRSAQPKSSSKSRSGFFGGKSGGSSKSTRFGSFGG